MRILLNKEIMIMTFSEERNKLRQKSFNDEGYIDVVPLEDVLRSSLEMERIYAPTLKMTKNQYLFITGEYEKESVVEAVANLTVDDIIKEKFHSNFWAPLTQEQVVQAWLHPESIEIVG